MNQYKFLKIYRDIAKSRVNDEDLRITFFELKYLLEKDKEVGHHFKKNIKTMSPVEMAFAIDAVAHNIHKQGKVFLNKVFPGGDAALFKRNLDELSGMESSSEVRKGNRGYYTPLMATEGMILLEKSQVGMTTKEDIKYAIEEYEKFIEIGIATPAMILTVYRFYNKKKYKDLVRAKKLHIEKNEPLVVGGPASVAIIDKQGHLITTKALEQAFENYMANVWARNMNVYHSDVQAGWCLPAYISSSGKIFNSGVNDHCLWVISEVRDDTRVAKRLAEEIIKGNIRCYSVGGSALSTNWKRRGSQSFMQIDAMELQEITYCEEGVNQSAYFDILKSIHTNNNYNFDEMLPSNFAMLEGLTFWDGHGNIFIKADRENSVTDMIVFELQKYIPDNISIKVSEDIPQESKEILIRKNKEVKDNNMPDSQDLEQFINSFENHQYDEIEHLEDMIDDIEENTDSDVSALEQFLVYLNDNSLSKSPDGAKAEKTPDNIDATEGDRQKKAMELAVMMGMPHGNYMKNPIRVNETPYKDTEGLEGHQKWMLNESGDTDRE